MSSLAAPKSGDAAPRKRKRGSLKKTQKTPARKHRPSHSVVIDQWGTKEHFSKEESEVGTCTNYGTCDDDEDRLHDVIEPDLNPDKDNKTPSDAPRAMFHHLVYVRQRSLQDDDGNSICGTAAFGEDVHCPLSKNVFFDDLIDKIYGKIPFADDYPKKKLISACAEDVDILSCAKWVKKYLECKIAYLEENPKKKVGIGQSKLHHAHIYIIQKLLELIENIIVEELTNTPRLSDAAGAAAAAPGKSDAARLRKDMVLIF
jgi:hypothetical protein